MLDIVGWHYLPMELTTEALYLEELARGLVCEIFQGWLEFSLEKVIG